MTTWSIVALCLTVAAVAFAAGYFLGRHLEFLDWAFINRPRPPCPPPPPPQRPEAEWIGSSIWVGGARVGNYWTDSDGRHWGQCDISNLTHQAGHERGGKCWVTEQMVRHGFRVKGADT